MLAKVSGALSVPAGGAVFTFAVNTMPNQAAAGGASNYWVDGRSGGHLYTHRRKYSMVKSFSNY